MSPQASSYLGSNKMLPNYGPKEEWGGGKVVMVLSCRAYLAQPVFLLSCCKIFFLVRREVVLMSESSADLFSFFLIILSPMG